MFAPTLPGHCGAPGLPSGHPPSVRAVADALERMLDDEGIQRAHISGNSIGGWLALELARRGRAESVTALSPGGAWTNDAQVARTLTKVRMGRHGTRLLARQLDVLVEKPRVRRMLFGQMVEHTDRLEPSELRAFMRDMVACPVFKPLLAAIMDEQLSPLSDMADCRIRIAWGSRDRIVPARDFLDPMRQRVPNAEFVTLPGVGHVPMSDDPQLVASTILEVTRPEPGRSRLSRDRSI